ncbi:inter-alpha-trypsin inhibitor heavy chain H5 [Microcaecilia unicolor]|uniref:Inter-alpha-trypsin inhibitor heavy chain H5 n=1 Tax=Microcaecilia unicolor TaxID=1415580 RepID=A0A6P7Z7A1_9AMPH|nr:inter-alpha-trypsin inhibitor heavy chain H5 [Microcaecilia unicolor]XP_030072501.1 inter-alpha-trypsin inhibitor heavy chain H5 [Microcaecilia unicolor]
MILLLLCFCCFLPVSPGEEALEIPEGDLEGLMMDTYVPGAVGRRVPRQAYFQQRRESKPVISEFTVKSTIISRYAFTAVSCTMLNRGSEAKEGIFQMQIPATAFISNFTMIVGSRVYQSEVMGKLRLPSDRYKKRNEVHSGTINRGETRMETFKASATIPGRNKVVFLLTYEELLQRRLGMYEHAISVRPLQLVGRLLVEVTVFENSGITSLEVPPLQNAKQKAVRKIIDKNAPPLSTAINQTNNFAKVTFNPNIVQQAKIAQNGILGDFLIRYDVNRDQSVGDIQVSNGFFAHYFAPRNLPPLPKNVVFVIDTSASMVGSKINQTRDALFTILRDLRRVDHFNIISFNNRIKVWQQDRLVKVTPDNIRDAKKFIYQMSPNGGTNINGGLQISAKLLNDYIAENGRHEKSVSLIIFLTDGRPTIGVTDSSSIVSNTKDAMREKICLFTIGIGNDVDYQLLEKLSLENCGMMRQIQEDEVAAAQLKGFYDEIGTPLLANIYIEYAEDSMEYITQNLFYNYFNGSEIVVAGKLLNASTDRLHVQITASNSDKYVILEKDVAIDVPEQHEHSFDTGDDSKDRNHIERLWGYLNLKELFTLWLKSDSNEERENLMEKARNLALAYNFVTPFTFLELKELEIQADRPKDYSTGVFVQSTSISTEGIGDQLLNLQGQKLRLGSVHKKEEEQVVSKTSADGDPHFVVDFPMNKLTVCFNIDGKPGDILQLVSDYKTSGVTVNGQLIGAPAPPNGHKKYRTYFSSITIIINKPVRSYVEITPVKVILDSKDRVILSCNKNASVDNAGLQVAISAKSRVTVTIQGTISFVILLHQYKNPAPFQRNHLGFYISKSKGLSPNSHGLLGQFLYNDVKITEEPLKKSSQASNQHLAGLQSSDPAHLLKVRGRSIPVVKKQRKIYNGLHKVDCWFAKNADKLIDGTYQDYLVPHPFDAGVGSMITNEL